MSNNRRQRADSRARLNLQPVKAGTASSALKAVGAFKQRIASAARNAVAVILRNEASDRYEYGQFDNLPNTIIAAVDNSGTATSCAGRLAEFIEADGFIQEGLDKVKANKKQSLRAVVSEAAANISYLKGFALRVIFDVQGNIVKVYNQDIKTIRRKGGDFEINPLMGEVGKRENETFIIPEFDPERDPKERREIIKKQIKDYKEQKGELVYIFKKGLGRYYDIYPVPDYYSSIEDVIADGKLSQLELRNIAQGFRTPVVISTGPIDDQNKDENEKTAQDYFDESLEDFTGEDASPILHLKGATEEFKPTVTVIDLAEILDQTDRATDRIAKKVSRLFRVPDILIGIAREGSLGNAQELKNQMALFTLTVFRLQEMIKEGFDTIAPLLRLEGLPMGADFTLSTLKPFDYLPNEVLSRLTDDEVREIFEVDLNAKDEEEAAISSRFGEFGVGGVQGILGVQQAVSDSTIDIMAGVKVLEIIYGFSRADAFQVLGGTEDAATGEVIANVEEPQTNEALANLTGRQMQNIQRIVKKYNKGELTAEQARLMIQKGFGLSDEDVRVFILETDSDDDNI